MRDEVIGFFHNLPENEPEQFNKAFDLYRRTPNKNTAAERAYNQGGYSSYNLGNLLYDLQTAHSISDLEKIAPVKLNSVLTLSEKLKVIILDADNDSRQCALYALKLATEYPDIQIESHADELHLFSDKIRESCLKMVKSFAENENIDLEEISESTFFDVTKLLSEEIKATSFPEEIQKYLESKNVDQNADNLDVDTNPVNRDDITVNILETVPATPAEPEALKFRDQYSFLKDVDCPDELKILAADKLTAFSNYQDCHQKLTDVKDGKLVLTADEEKNLAAAAVGWFEDGEEIKAELDYYQEHKTILGKHRIFARLAMQRKVDEMTPEKLNNFIAQTPSYISKKNKGIRETTDEQRKHDLNNDITERNEMLSLVNKKLGINGAK